MGVSGRPSVHKHFDRKGLATVFNMAAWLFLVVVPFVVGSIGATIDENILGTELEPCCEECGYWRDGYCKTDASDTGTHVVCAKMTEKFLEFTKSKGNDLITPSPGNQFPGLKEGDSWCLCAVRWKEALEESEDVTPSRECRDPPPGLRGPVRGARAS